jgi:hypothetical protein
MGPADVPSLGGQLLALNQLDAPLSAGRLCRAIINVHRLIFSVSACCRSRVVSRSVLYGRCELLWANRDIPPIATRFLRPGTPKSEWQRARAAG